MANLQETFTKWDILDNNAVPDMGKFIYKAVTGTLTVDTRKWKRGDNEQYLPIAVRVFYCGERVYLSTGFRYTMSAWADLCEAEKNGSRKKLKERGDLRKHLKKAETLTIELADNDIFTLKHLKEHFTGIIDDADTIYYIWKRVVDEKKADDKIGTAQSYSDSLKRFSKDNGSNVKFTDIDHSFIMNWRRKMLKEITETTAGIYLRTFRLVVNKCISNGYIKGDTKEMFRGTGYDKSSSRKHEFLDVPTWQLLYDYWLKAEAIDSDGKELFAPREKAALFRDLGLFIFMYLGDGQNLADTLRLKFGGWYFATHGTQLQFLRHKTRDRNEKESEVIFPITEEMKKIIQRHGNTPRLNANVFPILKSNCSTAQELDCIHRYNKSIRHHLSIVADILGIEVKPSATWARHSFATNLNNSGKVPYKYIADSMGHAGGGDITSRYIGEYPYEKMLEYNRNLLNDTQSIIYDEASLLNAIRSLSKEQQDKLINKMKENEEIDHE